MYGLWYVTFGFLAIAAVVGGLWIYFNRMWDKWFYEGVRLKNEWFHCHEYDKSMELKSAHEQAISTCNSYETREVVSGVICILSIIIGVVFALLSIFLPIGAKRDVEYFKCQSEYVEMAIENGTCLENIAITQTVIDQNKWLADAKSHLATWGTWSRYYGSGLEDLDPIIIER